MAITLKQLAQELGVSPATVSLALNGSPRIAPATRERARRLAEAYHYVPNAFGRALQSRKSRLLGLLMPSVTWSFAPEMMQGIGNEAAARHYGVLIGLFAKSTEAMLADHLALMLEKNVEGVLVSAAQPETLESFMPELEKRNIPVLYCSVNCPDSYSKVIDDDFHGGCLAARYLLANGHRRILGCTQFMARFDGNAQAVAEVAGADLLAYSTVLEAVNMIRHDHSITAVAAYSDMHAINLIHELKAFGIEVPRDLSVVGFDDLWFAARPEFNLTTVAQQKEEIGRLSVSSLLELVDGTPGPIIRKLAPEIIARGTVRAI